MWTSAPASSIGIWYSRVELENDELDTARLARRSALRAAGRPKGRPLHSDTDAGGCGGYFLAAGEETYQGAREQRR